MKTIRVYLIGTGALLLAIWLFGSGCSYGRQFYTVGKGEHQRFYHKIQATSILGESMTQVVWEDVNGVVHDLPPVAGNGLLDLTPQFLESGAEVAKGALIAAGLRDSGDKTTVNQSSSTASTVDVDAFIGPVGPNWPPGHHRR